MGAPVSLLGEARAFARDFPRDRMPKGYLWDVVDFVPAIIDAPLTGRGAWRWGSNNNISVDGAYTAGILMPYKEGDKLLASTDLNLYEIDQAAPFDAHIRGGSYPSLQNPIKCNNVAVHFSHDGSVLPHVWPYAGVPAAISALHKKAKVGCTYKTMLVSAGAPGEEDVVRFSVPAVDLTTDASFDEISFMHTSQPVTGLAALRSVILVFHAGSIERIRGDSPSHRAPLGGGEFEDIDGDMFVESLFERVGCTNPKTIAYWNDNCVFADEHGVHITDGAVIRNLTTQGGISYFWRLLYEGAASVCATTFLDYYIVTLRHPPGRPPLPPGRGEDPQLLEALEAIPLDPDAGGRPPVPPIPPDLPPIRPPPPSSDPDAYKTTLVCDLNRRQWYRFSNLNAVTLFAGGGSVGMERVWAGLSGYTRLARVGPMFYPDFGAMQTDDNGLPVTPRFETPWYRISDEGRKRMRFVYVSYDVRGEGDNLNPLTVGYKTQPEQDDYVQAGSLPTSNTNHQYRRYRLPIYKNPYGIAFFVEVTGETFATRIYDVAVEAQPTERSRV